MLLNISLGSGGAGRVDVEDRDSIELFPLIEEIMVTPSRPSVEW
jgi:hypothetical protein